MIKIKPPYHYNVKPQDIKPNEIYCGYEYYNEKGHLVTVMGDIETDNNGIPYSWGKYPIKEEVIFYHRKLSYQEEDEWYENSIDITNPRNQLNLYGLHTDLYSIGDATHEMWNGWIETDWKRQLISIIDEDFAIIGIAPAIGKWSMRDPVAVVIEYSDGDKYWCHAERDWIEDMRKESKKVLERLENACK